MKIKKSLVKKIFSLLLILVLFVATYAPYTLTPFSPKPVQANNCYNSSSPRGMNARVGGVALDQAATFLANMDDISGAYYDQDLDRIVFVGKKNTTLPEFDKDDLAVAIRAVIFNSAIPAVSIEDDPADPGGSNKKVYYYGGIENTSFGKVLYDADVKLKKYVIGYDENQQEVTSTVAGYKPILNRYLALGPDPNYSNSSSRFWITPKLITLKKDDPSNSFVFDQAVMEVKTEALSSNNDPKWNQAMTEFVTHHTQNYDQFAQETPSYAQAKQLGKIVAVIKWLADNNISSDFSWAKDYAPKIVTTPTTFPKITTPVLTHDGRTYQLSGGVQYDTPNTYNSADGTSTDLKNSSEAVNAPKEDIHWTFTNNGQQYESVAVAADAFRSLGSYSTSNTDMNFPMTGDLNLAFQRSYSSYSGGQEGIGRGWSFLPARLVDNKPVQGGFLAASCASSTYKHRYKLAFQINGQRESFTYSCDNSGTYIPDEAVYHSKITDAAVSSTETRYTVTTKDQTQYVFQELFNDPQKTTTYYLRLIEIKDKNGNKVTYNYDTADKSKLVSITDSNEHTITINYNSNNLVSSISDWSGRTVSYAYDDQGNLLTVTDPKNNVTTYTYDANNKLTAITDREGKIVVENTFTPEAKLATHKDAGSVITTYTHDDANRTVTAADNLGRSEKTKYDEKARILEQTDPALKSVKYTYGQEFSPLTVVDKNSNKTTYTYDANGNVTSVTYPDNKQVTYEYDNKNRVTKIFDYRYGITPKETKYTYDTPGNLTQLNEATILTNFTYDPTGEMLTLTDPLNKKTTWTRDSFGNKLTETDATNQTANFEYDGSGRLKKVTDADARVVSYTYDNNGNLITETTASGTTTNLYDKENRLIKKTQPNNSVTEYTYNTSGSMNSVKDALLNTTSYGYDTYQNLISRQDVLNRQTQYAYDQLNRRTQATTPLGKTTKWEYDANGNIAKRMDASNKETSYDYDTLNRLKKITYPDATTVVYTHDDRGNITKVVDKSGTSDFIFDIFNRIISASDPNGLKVSYEYDAAGNIKKVTYPDNKTVLYEYDDRSLLSTITDWNSKQTIFTYHKNKLLASKKLPNGVIVKYGYDESNRLNSMEYTNSASQILAKFVYQRDAIGNITKTTESGTLISTATTPPATDYTYDPIGRLKSAIYPDSVSDSYTYDSAGNRLSQVVNSTTTNYNYNEDNQVTTAGSLSNTFNANGNLTKSEEADKSLTYSYDFEDKLLSFVKATGPSIYETSYTLKTNKYAAIDIGSNSSPTFVDIDNDGDQDLFIGKNDGTMAYYKNTGSATSAAFTLESSTYSNIDIGSYNVPTFVDIDNDGDQDLFIGRVGSIAYYKNTGTDASPAFTLVTNTYSSITSNNRLRPAFGDTDNDGDFDLYVGKNTGEILFYKNTGNQSSAVFQLQTSFQIVAQPYHATPVLGDLDKDNDLDMLVGNSGGSVVHYRNKGTQSAPTFELVSNPISDDYADWETVPALVDIDNDGDKDLFVGEKYGALRHYEGVMTGPETTKTDYKYDGFGNRLEKATGSSVTRFVNDITGELTNVLAETNGSNAIQNMYVYGGGSLVSQGSSDASARSYPITDGMGNVRFLTDSAGASVKSYIYDPFGNIRSTSGSGNTSYQFNGQQLDNESGLYHLRARQYDPAIGRFISQDPIEGDIMLPQSQNPYQYAYNNPINLSDPSGEWVETGWDIANFAYDLCTGQYGHAAFDAVAIAVPFLPAGSSKVVTQAVKKFTPDQAALVDLAKEAQKKGVNKDDANTLLQWADEYKLPNRGPETHPNRPYGKDPHIHVGPVDHIFIK
jgi:RHS repeat-associated protein